MCVHRPAALSGNAFALGLASAEACLTRLALCPVRATNRHIDRASRLLSCIALFCTYQAHVHVRAEWARVRLRRFCRLRLRLFSCMTQSRVNSFGIAQPMGIDQCPSPFAYSHKKSRLWANYRINGLHTIGTSRKRESHVSTDPILRILPIVRFASLLRRSQDPSAPPTASDSDHHQIKTARSTINVSFISASQVSQPSRAFKGQTSHDENADESPGCQPKSRFLRSFRLSEPLLLFSPHIARLVRRGAFIAAPPKSKFD